MKFSYKARTKDGKMEIGTIEAYSKESAISLLQKYDIFVTFLEESANKASFLKRINFQRKTSKKDLAIFFRQLSVMLESQVPVVKSLSSLAAEIKKTHFRETIFEVAKLVQEGISFSQALSMYPETFSNFYVSLIRSGEASGKVAPSLYSISMHLEREHEATTQLKQAMIYPLFLMGVLLFVIGVIITQIMPKIEEIIRGSGSQPTAFVEIMLDFYGFLEKYWGLLFLSLLILTAFLIFYLRTKEGKKQYDEISLKIPLVGKLLKKIFLIRFTSNVSTLLISGVSINKALRITGEAVDNAAYKKIIDDVEKKVSEGEKLSLAMARHSSYFPDFVLQITEVGESTGKLDKTLMEVVNFYEKEVKRSIDLFSRLLEPIMIIILGIVVTILAMSILSSIYGAIGVI